MSVSVERRELSEQLSEQLSVDTSDLHPVLARVFQARGISDSRLLDYSLSQIHPFKDLTGMETAVELLQEALEKQQRVLIVGDFDADGATSVTVAMRGLKRFGFQHLDYLVPNRFEFGYGLTPEIVAVAADKNPDIIITVDNGISSIDGVAAAKQRGMKVLVTDHHLPGDTLPDADAIVNPNLHDDPFPSKALAGVGVMFYILMALRAHLRDQQWFNKNDAAEPNLGELLDIVALGTIADVVPLDHNNRILVSQGLARIRRHQCCPGISALIKIAGRNQESVVAADMGFGVGPRLNAAGRMTDMSVGIECLLTDDFDRATALAEKLDGLNKERREVEDDMKLQAIQLLDQLQLGLSEGNDIPMGLSLYNEDWHQGVIGILASRIKEQFHRPVIIFANAGMDDDAGEKMIKGSARSISQLHIRDTLDAVATKHPGLLVKFGGLAMAAGLSLRLADFESFSQAFNEEVGLRLSTSDLENIILSDGELDAESISMTLAEQIRNIGPWGQAFPEPIFDGVFDLVNRRIVGEHHL